MIPKQITSTDYFKVSGAIFGFVSVMHLLRILNHWVFVLGSWMFPYWLSWVAVFVAGYLSYQGFVLAGVIKK